MEIMEDEFYYLLDARAFAIWQELNNNDLTQSDEDNLQRFILLCDYREDCLLAAKTGEYGDNCIVTNEDYAVSDHWIKQYLGK